MSIIALPTAIKDKPGDANASTSELKLLQRKNIKVQGINKFRQKQCQLPPPVVNDLVLLDLHPAYSVSFPVRTELCLNFLVRNQVITRRQISLGLRQVLLTASHNHMQAGWHIKNSNIAYMHYFIGLLPIKISLTD